MMERSKKLILVIEDEPVIASLLKDHLEVLGHEVAVASSGTEGLRRAEYLKPDIITLDMMMPGLDGLQVLQNLKANNETRQIPVLLISVASSLREEGFSLGAVDFFKKPIDFKRLGARIKSLTSNEQVLVIDDNEEVLKLVDLKLSSMGYTVHKAGGWEEAEKMLEKISPDLILIDYMLPKKDGIEITEELKKQKKTAGIPVIIYSGYIYNDIVSEKIIGVDKFLGKQFSIEDLAGEVSHILTGATDIKGENTDE